MNVNFEYYKIFYYVAKYRNFTRAARVLGNSQPNITRAMNCLEQQVQATLFIRTNRGVQLTSEGEKLYNYVSAAMAQIFAAEEALSESDGLLHGNIVIGTSETALNIFLVDQLKCFHQSYPGIRLKIYNYSTPQALEAVRSGKVDFAVVSTPVETAGPLKVTSLASFQDILVGGRTFEHLTGRAVSLSELKEYSLMGLGRETMTYKFYNRFFMTHGQEFAPDIEVATTDQILLMVKSELGLAFVPEPMTRESLNKEEIVTIQLQEEIPMREICLVYDYQHPLNSAARQFVTLCKGC